MHCLLQVLPRIRYFSLYFNQFLIIIKCHQREIFICSILQMRGEFDGICKDDISWIYPNFANKFQFSL